VNLNKGYNIAYHWISDFTTLSSNQLSAQVSSLAFIDDTNWIAGN
ncbi:18242_t:CDS:1, partial [Funneliformis geosporum]